ncbi:MAG TPA: translation initiation factor IF-3 [Candidatus Paceibacterota bacterium]|nr:translation initiation factor IF-3 [Candidatus Paceibacterota bacterium]HJN63048.1 translation initiation factor IF-3 [Candidatus Paceibacterota bacterium]
MRNFNQKREERARVNEAIRANELRVLGPEGETFNVLSKESALSKAREMGLDLIEVSPNANPPVAKIMDYGKFLYDQKKKAKEAKAKSHKTETKNVQVKIGTGEHDLELKAKKASEWLKEGHRVKFDLYLRGRAKYLDKKFLEERMERMLKLITEDYKVADGPKKSPKGMTLVLEKGKAATNKENENK